MTDIAPIFGKTVIALRSSDAVIWMNARPDYCDRGRVLVHVEPKSPLFCVDHADLFPRYFFDLARAKAEMVDWLIARKQKVLIDWTSVNIDEFNPYTFGDRAPA